MWCKNESLQQKAYNVAIFHISLSVVVFLFFIFLPVRNQEPNDFLYNTICNGTIVHSNVSSKKPTLTSLMKRFIDMFEDGCKRGIIIGLLILFILTVDLTLNLLLLHGVSKRSNAHFVHWLVGQAVRILSCVSFICLITTLYVFDISIIKKTTADNDLEKTYAILLNR